MFKQDEAGSTWSPYNVPHIHNLEWDLREEHQIDFPHLWVLHPMAAAADAFLMSLAMEPPIKPGAPDPYVPPKPGDLHAEEHLQIGPITQFVTTIHQRNGKKHNGKMPQPEHGLAHRSGA